MRRSQLFIPKNISDQIYEILLEKIISGEYKTGERIDTTQLVNEFKVSRSPVKDAFNKLYGAGIIEISPRKGHYVRRISKQELVDLFEFRLILEVNAAKKAVKAVDQKVIEILTEIVEKGMKLSERESSADIVKVYHLDSQFHKTIVDLAQNNLIAKSHSNIHLLSHAVRTQFAETKERTASAQQEHKEILDALVKKSSKEVEEAITRHLKNAEKFLLAAFKGMEKIPVAVGSQAG